LALSTRTRGFGDSGGSFDFPGSRLSWPGSGSTFGISTICTGFGGSGSSTARFGVLS